MVTTPPRLLPFEAESAADAVSKFFEDYCDFTGKASGFRDELVSAIEMFVQAMFSRNWPDELEFKFIIDPAAAAGVQTPNYLRGPVPLVKFIEMMFGDSAIKLKPEARQSVTRRGQHFVLGATPSLVTFAGRVVWEAK